MYEQINPTQMFRERQLALLEEAGDRRLARQLRAGAERQTKERSTIAVSTVGLLAALLAAGLVALFALSVPALGKENDVRQQSVPRSDKTDAAIATTSTTTTPKASFASGSGANFLGVKVSNHGNLLSFESPQGQEAAFTGREGYALCSRDGTVHGHDTGTVEAGFGPPKFKQPNPGKFPLAVTRNTTDGNFQLKQVWSKPDATEKDVTVTMTVKNISNSTLGVFLSRSGDFDVGDSPTDQGGRTGDSAWLWDDPSSAAVETFHGGTMLTGLTSGAEHAALIEHSDEWAGVTREVCFPGTGLPTPTSAQDLAMRVIYALSLSPGQSKTVKLEYGRM